ncbi:hypothetical protein QO010_001923 [Caulobacter ginsengisoli]|uniref:DUF3293 domain-containing protein n=1 Tax=Caulobacter ginsengisoli TaxID=400775 RepID=A0ABU0IQ62_9CAUL|nr:DUF3293 domain-containing protein [Caulobacter ginsengisoli]MDQ0464152.1 hypothetical protein [Caulobacter ginsengisoli]
MTQIDQETLAAYEATDYRVDWPSGVFVLKIGRPSRDLARLYEAAGVTSAAYLSAWNPYSRIAPPEANAAAQAALDARLAGVAPVVAPGWGADPSGAWPPERSTLALGLSLDEAKRLAEAFRQNGFVWCGPDATPQLVLMR